MTGTQRIKKWIGLLAVLLGISGSLPVWAGEMTVHFLDVGQGLSVLVQSEGETLLYDGGDTDTADEVVSYLQGQGVETIDYMVASHYDSDHLGGLLGALQSFSVEAILGPDYEKDSELYRNFTGVAQNQGLSVTHPSVGSSYALGDASFEVMAPSKADAGDSNDCSVVLKVTNGADSFLLTGDAGHTSEEEMVAAGLDLSCDVLQVGHHGSAGSTSWDLLQAAVPEYAVISCGTGNSYGHPDADTMEKLESMDIQVLRTDKQGTVTATSTGNGITWDVQPCNDYSSGDASDMGTLSGSEAAAASTEDTFEDGSGGAEETSVWVSATGSKYHCIPDCGSMDASRAKELTQEEAEALGYEPCKKCFG